LKIQHKIPRTMSTQHPDNVAVPFFANSQDMSGEDEIQEAYYVFSHLQCQEQMWDCEGKEVDDFVVRKLLTQYEHFFALKRLGQDVFLTLRVPNPTVEQTEGKVLIETLESIPRSFDAARLVYGEEIPPIFEVILPMTTSHKCLNRVYYFYKDFVAGRQTLPFFPGDISIAEWVGDFKPEEINVIPLFEDRHHMLEAAAILRRYLENKPFTYQRVFLARSDPALNYGMISAVLLNKVALQRLAALEKETGVEIYPILGVGSAPFRGNLKPHTVERVLAEYPDVQTFTIQSAFKYDYPVAAVLEGIRKINAAPRGKGVEVDEERCIRIIDSVSRAYASEVRVLAPLVNYVASAIPQRRKRKLHIGLFGYARETGGVSLPRAIGFCAACYSIGLPPELLGYVGLDKEDARYLRTVYHQFDQDLEDALPFFNEDVFKLLPELRHLLRTELFPFRVDEEHRKITSRIIKAVKDGRREGLARLILEAGYLRGFLG